MRALDADGMSPALLGVILVAGLAGVWTSWLIAARVPVYQLSEAARLEVERIHPVASPVVGRVVSTSLVLGREVQKGDVLLEVEAEREKLETAEERTRLASVSSELSELERQIRAEQEALDETRRASQAALAEAAQRLAGAEVAARVAQEKVARSNQLESLGLLSAAEAEAARGEAQGKRADVAAARVGIERLKAEQLAAERQKRGAPRLTRSRAGRVSRGFARRRHRRSRGAKPRPSDGASAHPCRVGWVRSTPIQIGAVVREGERLASIIPQGKVRVVAEFSAPSLGRVKPGQTGALAPRRISLDPVRLRRRDGDERGERDARSARARGAGRPPRRRLARFHSSTGCRGRSKSKSSASRLSPCSRGRSDRRSRAKSPPHPPHSRRRAAISDRPCERRRTADVRAGGHPDLGDGLRSGGAHLPARGLRHPRQLRGDLQAACQTDLDGTSINTLEEMAGDARARRRADHGPDGSCAARRRQRAAVAGGRGARADHALSDRCGGGTARSCRSWIRRKAGAGCEPPRSMTSSTSIVRRSRRRHGARGRRSPEFLDSLVERLSQAADSGSTSAIGSCARRSPMRAGESLALLDAATRMVAELVRRRRAARRRRSRARHRDDHRARARWGRARDLVPDSYWFAVPGEQRRHARPARRRTPPHPRPPRR